MSKLMEITDRLSNLERLTSLITEKENGKSFKAGDIFVNRLYEDHEMQVFKCTCVAGGKMAEHFHEDSTEYITILTGKLQITVGDATLIYTPGDSCVISRFMEHSQVALEDTVFICTIIPPESIYKQ